MGKRCLAVLCCVLCLCGCSIRKEDSQKLRDVEITVLNEREIPQELAEKIDEMKTEPFHITYGDRGYLYIAKGYGRQDTSGYSIEVEKCYETSDTICFETNLLGPPNGEEISERETFPYIVVKTEYSDKYVEFK